MSSDMTSPRTLTPLEVAINIAGSQTKLAKLVGVTRQAVQIWLTETGMVPLDKLEAVAAATGLRPAYLRPDIARIFIDWSNLPPRPPSRVVV